GDASWLQAAQYWIYPIQTLVCGALLGWFWRQYQFQPLKRVVFTIAVALLVFAIWISPEQFGWFAPRRDGFNPDVFSNSVGLYWIGVGIRFVRLVIVVPLVEEIFFRGFLLRYFIREEFESIPIRTFSWHSFSILTVVFPSMHSPADWVAGLLAGALYNGVAYRTRSLTSCVLAHSVTNLLLGLWIMKTQQWGFW